MDGQSRFALMAGGLVTYVWAGFPTDIQLHGASDLFAHAVLAGMMCLVLVFAGWRNCAFAAGAHAASGGAHLGSH